MTDARRPRFEHVLVTGGAGFIGSCFVRDLLARRDGSRVSVLDKLTYAGNRANLAPVEADPEQASRLRFVVGDIADPAVVAPLVAECDAVVNFAAESHVDRSILDPEAFLRTDVLGVHILLEACRAEQERVRAGDRALVDERGESRIAAGDLAAAALDELEQNRFPGQRFTAGY